MEKLKENINTILLVAITLMVSYDVFLKNDSQIVYQKGNSRAAVNKQPAQQQQQQFQQPQQQQPFEGATTTINNTQQQPPLPENAQNTNPPTAMAFAETSHDFGAINQDSKHTKVFEFKNTGDKPLLIETARGSCGCTVPNYPKQPIPPGETGEIEVVYSPGKQKGKQNKSVTIIANTEPRTTVLQIAADVAEI
tara:strand:+ start:5230 stop:5811 length:582 start_codon:yes stop_codon:yes gene_type:complete